jgi:hypothetical protein
MKKKTSKKKVEVTKPKEKKVICQELLDAVAEIQSRLSKVNFSMMPHTDDCIFEFYIGLSKSTVISLLIDTDTNESFIVITDMDKDRTPVNSVIVQAYDSKAIFDADWRKYIVTVICKIASLFSYIFSDDSDFEYGIDEFIEHLDSLPYKN